MCPPQRPAERDEREQRVAPGLVRFQPVERGAQIEQVPAEQVEHVPRRLAGVDPLQLGDPPVGVRVAQQCQLTGVTRPVERVLAHGLQQPVLGLGLAVTVGVLVELHEALVDESPDEIHDRPLVEIAGRGAERLGQAEPERACADAQPAQHPALVIVEQVVAPLHGGQQRLLARQDRTRTAGEQPEALAEVVGDPLRGELAATRRSQLDGQWDPVELLADVDHRLDLHRAQAQVRSSSASAVDEQHDRVEPVERRHIERRITRTVPTGRDPPRHLAGQSERFATRRQHDEVRAAAAQRFDRRGRIGHEVLAVVEHDHRRRTGQPIHGRSRSPVARRPRSPRSPRAASNRSLSDLAAGPDPPTTPRPGTRRAGPRRPVPRASSCPPRRSRSASPAAPVPARRPDAASSATRPINGVVSAGRLWRKVSSVRNAASTASEIGMGEQPQLLRTIEILQPVLTDIDERGTIGQRIGGDRRRARRHEDLTAIGRVADPRRPDDRRPHVVALVALHRLTGVHPDADAQLHARPATPHAATPAACPAPQRSRRMARENAATTLSPSPCSTGRAPDHLAIAPSTISSWRAMAAGIAAGWRCQATVEPSTSVSRNVTVPVGKANGNDTTSITSLRSAQREAPRWVGPISDVAHESQRARRQSTTASAIWPMQPAEHPAFCDGTGVRSGRRFRAGYGAWMSG